MPPDADGLLPEKLEDAQDKRILRDARNVVWSAPFPGVDGERIVVKRFAPRAPHRIIIDRFRLSRAQRSWNGANELLRRGISTPRPLAFVQGNIRPGITRSYYICEEFHGTGSVRGVFTAFAAGEQKYQGIAPVDFYKSLAGFLFRMHERGVFFRDLSAGNVLLKTGDDGGVRFSLIDTARARFRGRPVPLRERLSDLKRICHPLHWDGRNEFVSLYLAKTGRRFSARLRRPFVLYDLKHAIKNRLRRRSTTR